MTSEVVLLISILCLIKCTCCGNYGFGLGQGHSNDELLLEELLTKDTASDETIINYTYVAEKPVTHIQLRTDTNIYTEVTFSDSYIIHIKLSNFESQEFNATLSVYGFPWHPDGPEPDNDIPFLLKPHAKKVIYLNKSSVEDSSIIATNGAYLSEEKSSTYEGSNGADEIEEDSSSSSSSSSSAEYYDYDYTSTIEVNAEEEREVQSIINAIQDIVTKNGTIALKSNFFIFVIFFYVTRML